MKTIRTLAALGIACAVFCAGQSLAAAPMAKPEDVGISSARLKRVDELVQRHVDAGSFTGAVTLVARNGRIARLEAQGLMDLEHKTPMRKDAIFRIMSMTKPIVGTAILMMVEEGKVRLQDPISRFVPEWKNMVVAVPQDDPPAGPGAASGNGAAAPKYYTVPAEREVTVRDLLTHTSGLVSGRISGYVNRSVAAGPRRRWPITCRVSAACRSSSNPARAGRTAPRPASTSCRASSR